MSAAAPPLSSRTASELPAYGSFRPQSRRTARGTRARRPVRVLFVTAELAPWAKVGGLGEVARDLPLALRRSGIDVRILVPAYRSIREAFPDARQATTLFRLGENHAPARLMQILTPVPAYVIDCPAYYDHAGNVYQTPEGVDWPNNHLRFGLLSRVAALLGGPLSPIAWRPDVIHCNDWQCGPAASYLERIPGARAATVMTVHNLAYQGIFPPRVLHDLDLTPGSSSAVGFEHHGQVSFLKAGLRYATKLTTVSPTYAREIQTPELGCGLDDVLRRRNGDIAGILNGIDTDVWDPLRNPHLPRNYGKGQLGHKSATKRALRAALGLKERGGVPVLGIVARLVSQKGVDLVMEAAAEIMRMPAQLAIIGQGERGIEDGLRALAGRHPGEVAVRIGFEERLAHRVVAGSDVFLMPSRFEPCGLTPMQAACCGTPSIVRRTGGLSDSVLDATDARLSAGVATGFAFDRANGTDFISAVHRAMRIYRNPVLWRGLQHAAMSRDFSWQSAIPAYAEVYRSAVEEQRAGLSHRGSASFIAARTASRSADAKPMGDRGKLRRTPRGQSGSGAPRRAGSERSTKAKFTGVAQARKGLK